MEGHGRPPDGLLEARVVERFHWTWDELDRQDEGRTERALALLNLEAAYRRVKRALEVHALSSVSQQDWELFNRVLIAGDESSD